MQKEYRKIKRIAGPLVFVEKTEPVGYSDLVRIRLPDGTIKNGQVLDTSDDIVVLQVFEGTSGIDKNSIVKFLGDTIKLSVSEEKDMEKEFGKQYIEYKKKTPAFIPKLSH